MRGTNGARWYAIPLRIVPDRGQRSENVSKPSIQQLWTVFQCDVLGSKLANEPEKLPPQTAAFSGKTELRPADRKILTREPSADDINGNSIGSKSVCGEFSHVGVAGDVGPVLCKDTSGELLYFAESYGFETAGALKTERKSADAGKQIEHPQLRPSELDLMAMLDAVEDQGRAHLGGPEPLPARNGGGMTIAIPNAASRTGKVVDAFRFQHRHRARQNFAHDRERVPVMVAKVEMPACELACFEDEAVADQVAKRARHMMRGNAEMIGHLLVTGRQVANVGDEVRKDAIGKRHAAPPRSLGRVAMA